MVEKVKIVLPDTGPLITLAQANALNVLLAFDQSQVQIVLTDMVEFEATRLRSTHEDAQRIASFIEANAGLVLIEKTTYGQLAIAAAKAHERYSESQQVRDFFLANGISPPPPLAQNGGEISITSYVSELIGVPPGPPCLIIAEDDFFLRSTPGALPGNAHIISTASLLAKLEELDPRFKAREILDAAKRYKGRDPNRAQIDSPAPKIEGGTSWVATLNSTNLISKLKSPANPVTKSAKKKP